MANAPHILARMELQIPCLKLEAVSKEKGYGKAMTYWENCLVGLGSYEVSQLKFFWQQQLQ
jgi:hypothetical protein